jgi:hypothetical protein
VIAGNQGNRTFGGQMSPEGGLQLWMGGDDGREARAGIPIWRITAQVERIAIQHDFVLRVRGDQARQIPRDVVARPMAKMDVAHDDERTHRRPGGEGSVTACGAIWQHRGSVRASRS